MQRDICWFVPSEVFIHIDLLCIICTNTVIRLFVVVAPKSMVLENIKLEFGDPPFSIIVNCREQIINAKRIQHLSV